MNNKYVWEGKSAIIFNVRLNDLFEISDNDINLKDQYQGMTDLGYAFKSERSTTWTYRSIKRFNVPTITSLNDLLSDELLQKDTAYYNRYAPQYGHIYPFKVLLKKDELPSVLKINIGRYYRIRGNEIIDYQQEVSLLPDAVNLNDISSVSYVPFNFPSSVGEINQGEFKKGLEDAIEIMNMMTNLNYEFTPSIIETSNPQEAANSKMEFNIRFQDAWLDKNYVRSLVIHEIAHNFLNKNFPSTEEQKQKVNTFMEFATGIDGATWQWLGNHNYPVIDGNNYSYIEDCLVAAACQLASKIPDRPVDTRAVDLGLPSGLLWSSYNLGAENENEPGELFAWADPSGKSYNQSTYTNVVEASIDDISSTKYDIATMTLGNGWHMPNKLDFEELREECEWTYITTPFVGWKVTGPNNNSILLPMCGNRQGDGTIARNGTAAFYWTSTNYSGLEAVYYTFSTSAKIAGRTAHSSKYIGMSIRPVKGTSNVPKSDDKNPSPYDNAAVDLGLSVDWASYNIGATETTGAGNKYAWGETEIKDSCTPNNYEYYDYDAGTYISLGLDDISGSEYDPVHLLWGGDWQMPTNLEIMELISECNWSWDKINGVDGFTITSKLNGNSIFLPVTEDNEGSYWSSTLYTLSGPFYNNSAYYLNFSENYIPTGCQYYYRYIGRCIRPVKIKR